MERRHLARMRSYLGARIHFGQGLTFDCVVRNMSESGARLSCSSHVMLPQEFDLHVTKQNRSYRVATVWRSEEAIGVAVVHARASGNVVSFDPNRRIQPPY